MQQNKEPHLIALDVDGTLVDHNGVMSEPVRRAARAAHIAGHHLVIATGRSIGATYPIAEHLGVQQGFCVSSNGGVTVLLDESSPGGFEVLDKATFDPAPALKALRQVLPTAKFALESESGEFLALGEFQDASFGAEAKSVSFHEMLDATAVRVVVFSTDTPAEEFGKAVSTIGLHGVTYSVGWTAWLDIAAQSVTKASALEQVRKRLNIPHERTVAIGDGRNDIEMLEWAARGVAMGQAPEEVRLAANELTHSVYDDGAATILSQYS